MNICYVANSIVPSRNANSIHVMKMCQAYANLGHRVTLIVPEWKKGVEPGVEDVYAFYGVSRNFTIRKVPLPRWRLDILHFGILMPLAAVQTGPTLVHSRGLSATWGLTNFFRKATVYELHRVPPENPRQKALFKRITTSKHLRALVAITRSLASELQPLLPETARLLVAPDGVDAGWLQHSISPGEARAKIGLAQETRRVAVYTGHLYKGRGIELIIELARRLPDHLFLVVGGRENDLARYREQAGNLSNLQLVGFKPPAEVPLYLQAADVLLMPHARKVAASGGGDIAAIASPIKMFEYMSAGRPILASTLPVLQEVLQHEINSLLLPYDHPEQWCNALRQLQQDTDLAGALGQRARADVEQYTWENRAQRLLEQIG